MKIPCALLKIRRASWRGFALATLCLPIVSVSVALTGATGNYQLVGWGFTWFPDSEIGSVKAMAGGRGGSGGYTLAIRQDGSLVGWGNFEGLLEIPEGGSFKAVAAASNHNMALTVDGAIVDWSYISPIGVPGSGYTAVDGGMGFVIALRADGSIGAWGPQAAGKMAPPPGTGFQAISAGDEFAMALTSNGSIVAWGDNTSGQLNVPAGSGFKAIEAGPFYGLALTADGSIVAWGDPTFSPTTNLPSGTGYTAIAGGESHALALKADGSVVAWGSNQHGESTPPAGTGFIGIAAGDYYSLAWRADGSWEGWGDNDDAQSDPPPFAGLAKIAAGEGHDLALRADGSLVSWGRDSWVANTPPPGGTDYTAVARGDFYSLALKVDGSIVAWETHTGAPASAPEGADFTAIATAAYYALALKKDGSIVAWGFDFYGTTTPPSGNDFKAISAGATHALALRTDGSVVAWGSNILGESTVPAGNDFAAISAGKNISIALKSDGSIVGWPSALGDFTTPPSQRTPPPGTGYTAIAAGHNYGLALTASGEIVHWGDSNSGTMSPPPSGTGFVAISAGEGSAVALRDPNFVSPAVPVPTVVTPGGRVFTTDDLPVVVQLSGGDISKVARVDLYLDGDLAGSKTTAPFEFLLGGVTPQTHELFAQVIGVEEEGSRNSNRFLAYKLTGTGSFSDLISVLLYLWSQPSAVALAQTERALDSTLADLDLILYNRLLTEIVAPWSATPSGQYYSDLANRSSVPLIDFLLTDPDQAGVVLDALVVSTPAVQAIVDNNGGSGTITEEMVTAWETFFGNFRAVASEDLVQLMDAERVALDPTTMPGLTAGQFFARVESQTRPPPAITAQPLAKTVVIGSDATFSVQPTGAGPITYQWRRNGADIAGATNASYTATDVQPGGGGSYSVVVTNPFGSTTSSAATLALDTTPRLINFSCLASAGVGDSTLVAGFFINGTGSKELLIRGIGPRLTSDPFNRTGVVADPQISVYDKDGVLIASNDNWDPVLAADFSRMGAFGLTVGSNDAALKITLPGNDRYTVHLVNTGTIADGLIEIYDFSRDQATRLSNVSCRLDLKANETVILGTSLIANPVPVLAFAIGPGLANYGIPLADTLPDPDVRVYAGSTEIAFNEDWNSSLEPYFVPAGAFPLTAGSKDAVARVTFSQGGLTIHATGKGQSGVAIIQLFESPEPAP